MRRLLPVAVVLAALLGCGPSGPAPRPRFWAEVVAQGTLKPEGTSMSPHGLELLVPAGAVEEEVAVTIEILHGLDLPDAGSPVFRFLPLDQGFVKDVELVITFEGDPASGRVQWSTGGTSASDTGAPTLDFGGLPTTLENSSAHAFVGSFGIAYVAATDLPDDDTAR